MNGLENFFAGFQEFTLASVGLRLTMALVFGGIIGLERGRKRRAAGFRTYMVVCLGATLTMLLGQYVAAVQDVYLFDADIPKTDVARFAAQVINGIGFLGAGTIIVGDRQNIKGLTTAAGLWASACMGLAIGAGFYWCAMLGLILMLLCNMILPFIEVIVISRGHMMELYVEYFSLDNLREILDCVKFQNLEVIDVKIGRERKDAGRNPYAVLTLWQKGRHPHSKIIAEISKLDCISAIEEN